MRPSPRGEGGSVIVIAVLAVTVMILLGFSLLAITDTQAGQSGKERARDQAFNLSESVLTDEAMVLGRSWPDTAPSGDPVCSAAGAGFADVVGGTGTASQAVARLRDTISGTYPDVPYQNPAAPATNAPWQVNLCDNVSGTNTWTNAVLSNKTWDANRDDLMWVRAQSTVRGQTRVLVGEVRVLEVPVFDSRYGLVAGTVNDDLGSSINGLSSGALGSVLSSIMSSTPTVASDPSRVATNPPSSGITGLRCGALDTTLTPPRTCLAGTLGATAAVPLVNTLLTGGKLEQFPSNNTIAPADAERLRSQAAASRTYYATSVGAATPAAAPACDLTGNTGIRSASTVVFIEKVGGGDDYCYIDVSGGVQWKALVIGSGRVIIRGNNTTTAPPVFTTPDIPQVNTFSGVIYALNNQRKTTANGGLGLGDSATSPREVVRIEKGAHVKGQVSADGRGGQVTVIPPPVTIDNSSLVDALIPCTVVLGITNCTLRNTIKALGAGAIVDALINAVGLTAVTNAIVGQVGPQRAAYGSAITADVSAIKKVTVYGPSGIVQGTFAERDN